MESRRMVSEFEIVSACIFPKNKIKIITKIVLQEDIFLELVEMIKGTVVYIVHGFMAIICKYNKIHTNFDQKDSTLISS